MAITSSANNYSLIDDCSNATTWNGESPVDVTDFYITGTSCVGFTIRDASQVNIYLDTGTYDLSGNVHLRCWFMTTALKEMDIFANDGVQFYVTDGSNTAYWTVLGSDTYPGGWYPLVVDLTSTPTSGTIPTDMSVCTTVGLRFNTTGAGKNFQNTWIDHLHLNDGIIIYGDDGGGSFDFDDVLAEDENTSKGWGIIRKVGGVYYLTGSLTFGDGSGTNSCDFADTGQVVVFEDRQVSSSLYDIEVVDNGTGTTEFQLGSLSGTSGISGCVIRTESLSQSAKFTITATDVDISDFKLYGTTFLGGGAISLPAASANVEIFNCSFEQCSQVNPSTAEVTGCFFINTSSSDGAMLWGSTSTDVENSSFIANTTGPGIEHDTAYSAATGTVTTGDATGVTLYDSAASFLSTVSVGDVAYNETDNSYANVINVVSNTELTTDGLTGGSDDQWDSSDAYSVVTPYIYTNLIFSGNTYDVDNTVTGDDAIAINKSGTSNPSSYPSGDHVAIQASVDITITVKDEDNAVIQNVQTAVYKTSDRTQLMNEDTNASGIATEPYVGTTPVEVEVRCRKASSGATKYINYSSVQNISSSGLTLDVTLREDPNNNATS